MLKVKIKNGGVKKLGNENGCKKQVKWSFRCKKLRGGVKKSKK